MVKQIDPRKLTTDLGGAWMRSYGTAPCPCCQPERRKTQNALTISERDGRLLLHCKKLGCDFTDILRACGIQPGGVELDLEAMQRAQRERQEAERKALRRARSLWDYGGPIQGTPGETYLRGRGITCELPESLRWVPDLYHQLSGRYAAAIVANVADVAGEPMGVHRTFFGKQGTRLGQNAKMMLGPCRGGAVRLSEADGALVVAEGIETGLSLLCGLMRGPASVWATLSTSGMAGLVLPPDPGKLTIATDGDSPGRAAGAKLAERATALGWKVSVLPAPDGRDWNDVLLGKGVAA